MKVVAKSGTKKVGKLHMPRSALPLCLSMGLLKFNHHENKTLLQYLLLFILFSCRLTLTEKSADICVHPAALHSGGSSGLHLF
jgi:hypothetical protein